MNDAALLPIEPTAIAVLNHFRREEKALEHLLESARRVRAGLVSGDRDAQQAALREHLLPPPRLRDSRRYVREQIATALKVPIEEATVLELADRASPTLRDKLLATHQRLVGKLEEIDRLNRANAVLAAYLIDLIQKLIGDPAGTASSAGRYSASCVLQWDYHPKQSGLQVRC